MERRQHSAAQALAWTAAIFAGYWIAGFLLVRLAYFLPTGASRNIGPLIAGVIAVIVARMLRVRLAVYLFSAFAAFSITEFAIEIVFGYPVAGRSAQFGVIVAALVAAAIYALPLAAKDRSTSERELAA